MSEPPHDPGSLFPMAAKDITSRDILKRLTEELALQILGIEAKVVETLETQNQRVEDRRADLVARMRGGDGEEFLLHVEVVNNNDSKMPLRMLRYYTDIRLAKHRGPIRQFLIYIGSERLTMPAGIDEPGLEGYRYTLVDMHQIDCSGLLTQDNPDALVLAILCDFGGRDPKEVVSYIVRRLKALLGEDERGFRDYMNMLEIYSENRGLEPQIKEAEHMLTRAEVERLPSFAIGFERGTAEGMKKGIEKGIEKGREEGMEAGMERGMEKGKAQLVRLLLNQSGIAEVSELLGLTPEEVERIAMAGDDDARRAKH